jgi:polysaccharide pyruvyl transferase WcaK-like protein
MINKALLMGASGKGNYGDELLAWTTVNLLKSINPDIEGIVLSYNPIISSDFFIHENFDFSSYYNYFPSFKYPKSFLHFRSIKKFKEYDVAIFPGGGFLYDYSLSALLSWYRRFLALNKIKVPIVLLGVGIGPLRTSLSRLIGGKILDLCKLIIVRDKISYDL